MKYNGYEICVSIAVCYEGTQYIVDEFDTMQEAKKAYKGQQGYEFWYLAAEYINKDGDTNPACWGKTRKEALDRLKNAL